MSAESCKPSVAKNSQQEIQHRQGYHSLANFTPKIDERGKHCLNCDKVFAQPKRKYCSSECAWQFFSKHNWAVLSVRCLKRDKYTCAKCGWKPERDERGYLKGSIGLISDHIIPIALGGSEFDEANVQTLCLRCNREKTADDIRKISQMRRDIKSEAFFKLQRRLEDFGGAFATEPQQDQQAKVPREAEAK